MRLPALLALALLAAAPAPRAAAPKLHLSPRICPLEDAADRRPGDVCLGARGRNWHLAFVYPAAAARVPALDALLRRRAAEAASDFGDNGIPYARKHSDIQAVEEHVYRLDAATPQLLALSSLATGSDGGAHGWFVDDTLLWDVAAGREVRMADLFTDAKAGFAEMATRFCSPLAEVRRREAARGGGTFEGPCPKPPYNAALTASSGRIRILKLTMDELDGYAGGTYEVFVPVTPRLIALLKPRYRPAFAPSAAPLRACNSNVRPCAVGKD